jgi:pimeloyl-ACP methyl ester carboxylesterase
VGSQELVHPAVVNTDCRTPAARYGWDYEAINYDKADDLALAAAWPGMTDCGSQGAPAGDEVVSSDGVHLDGWYIPSAAGTGPRGPTVVIVHGGKSNKSEVLKYAAAFHDRYNLVLPDLRNSGRSSVADSTMGVREQWDVRAMVDWLVQAKQPRWIGLMGNSMGAATALAEAGGDERISALVLDSMHAQLVLLAGNIAETENGYPSVPTSWAVTIAASIRLWVDVTSVDPVRTIAGLGNRPVLLLHGTADPIDRPDQSAEVNLHAAREAGVPATLHYCVGARHGLVIDTCPSDWAGWANWFFASAGGV